MAATQLQHHVLPAASHGKLTVVLDIDETLIHTTRNKDLTVANGMEIFKINVFGECFNVIKRPNLNDFLEKAAAQFELISFTAGVQEYSSQILKHIDPFNKYFKHHLYRQHCSTLAPNLLVKDLRIINRSLDRAVLVDNSLSNMMPQPENGIPITSFTGDHTDTALSVLFDFLSRIDQVKDVRVPLGATFLLSEFLRPSRPQHIDESEKPLLQSAVST